MRWILLLLALFWCSQSGATNWCNDANNKGCWLFEDSGSTTTMTDSSSNGFNGTFNASGKPAYYNSSLPGSYSTYAVSFAGGSATDNISLSASALNNLTPFSWVSYVYVNSLDSTNRRIFDKTTGTDGTCRGHSKFFVNNYGCSFNVTNWSDLMGTFQILSTFPTGSWVHLAITYSFSSTSNIPVIYFNGVSQSINVYSTPAGTVCGDDTRALNIGNRSSLAGTLDGKLDEIAIFNSILSSSDVSTIMTYGLNPSSGGVSSYPVILRNSIIRNSIIR